jgi:alpha-1,2-mannosyltransferase
MQQAAPADDPTAPRQPRGWPSRDGFVRFFQRFGLYLLTVAALVGMKWRGGYDLEAFLGAARDVARGLDPYAATRALGVGEWGTEQVFVSPPFVAHILAPVSGLPIEILHPAWTVAGIAAVLGAIRLLPDDTLARQAPKLVFAMVYLWASVFLGQVNLFVLAGLLLALGSRNDRWAGLGLALAIVLRATPAAFAIVLILERRWRALGWTAIAVGLAILVRPADWASFIGIARDAAGLPTLDVPVQTSIAALGPLPVVVALASAVVLVAAIAGREQRVLLAGTAIGLVLVLLPTNSWHHWFAFALAPLLLFAHQAAWSRRALAAFLAASFLPMGWPSVLVALAVLGAMLWVSARILWHQRPAAERTLAGILGRP